MSHEGRTAHSHHHDDQHGQHDDTSPKAKRDRELAAFIQSVREQLAEIDARILAKNTGTNFDAELLGFDLAILGREFFVPYPSFVVHEAGVEHHEGSLWIQALVAHYFRTADGTAIKDTWVSFQDLPNGMLYVKAFQGYTGDKLAKAFGNDVDRLHDACRKLRGKPLQIGDVAYCFQALPRVPVAVVYWTGDEDFPPTAQLLFDESACHYLPTDSFATIGGRLCNMILNAAGLIETMPPGLT